MFLTCLENFYSFKKSVFVAVALYFWLFPFASFFALEPQGRRIYFVCFFTYLFTSVLKSYLAMVKVYSRLYTDKSFFANPHNSYVEPGFEYWSTTFKSRASLTKLNSTMIITCSLPSVKPSMFNWRIVNGPIQKGHFISINFEIF